MVHSSNINTNIFCNISEQPKYMYLEWKIFVYFDTKWLLIFIVKYQECAFRVYPTQSTDVAISKAIGSHFGLEKGH